MAQQDIKLENFEDRLKSIEQRLVKLESELALNKLRQSSVGAEEYQTDESILSETIIDEEKGLESKIGRVGLAWLGNLVLLFAIIFFTEYIIAQGHSLLSLVIGVFAAGIIFWISNYLKNTNSGLSFMLKINGQVLLFYEAFRMHFFSDHPLISSKIIVLVILCLVIAFQIYTALKNGSQTFGFLAMVFALFTAIMSDTTHIMLPLITFTAIGAVYFFFKHNWQFLLIAAIFLFYAAFFLRS